MSYFSLSGMGRTRLFSDGNKLVSRSLDGFQSRRNQNPQSPGRLLPSFSPGAPALLSGNASPVPAGPSLLPHEHELLLLSRNKKRAGAFYKQAGLVCCPNLSGRPGWRQESRWIKCRK